MIPITLVTGFLGSGKTTLLQHIVERHRDRPLAYLVNEFSPVDVDGRVLDLPTDQLVTIAGGSIFCRCLVTEFIEHLRTIARRAGEIHGVIIEASGIANPKVVAEMLQETRLDSDFRLDTIITVIDPGTFGDLLETLPNITAQVESAGIAIVNKTDLYDEDTLRKTEADLRKINPTAKLIRAAHCHVDIEPFAESLPTDLRGDYALCTDPNYGRVQITPADDLTESQLREVLESVRPLVYRLKGFVYMNRQNHYVDVTPATINITPTDRTDTTPSLVCIFPPAKRDAIRSAFEPIEPQAPGTLLQ